MALTQKLAHAIAQIVLLIKGVVPRCVLYVSIQLEDVSDLRINIDVSALCQLLEPLAAMPSWGASKTKGDCQCSDVH